MLTRRMIFFRASKQISSDRMTGSDGSQEAWEQKIAETILQTIERLGLVHHVN